MMTHWVTVAPCRDDSYCSACHKLQFTVINTIALITVVAKTHVPAQHMPLARPTSLMSHMHMWAPHLPLLLNDGLDLSHTQGGNSTQHAVLEHLWLAGAIPAGNSR